MESDNGTAAVETAPYTAFLRRAIRALGRRVADGDVEDLAELLRLRDELDAAAAIAVAGLHERYSWQRIADVLGVTRQAAMQRWPDARGSRRPGGQPSHLR